MHEDTFARAWQVLGDDHYWTLSSAGNLLVTWLPWARWQQRGASVRRPSRGLGRSLATRTTRLSTSRTPWPPRCSRSVRSERPGSHELSVHWREFPERLGGWLATTARNECLRIRRKAGAAPELRATEPDTLADLSIGPKQRVIDTHITRRLWDMVAELPARRRVVLEELFTEAPRPYPEVARKAGIPLGGIGPHPRAGLAAAARHA
jgi:hypothetical protein